MSNDTKIVLDSIASHTTIWLGFLILIAGNVGCIANLTVFRSRTFARQACFIYLFWEAIVSFFILDCILLTRILESGFEISFMTSSDAFCRIREFISMFMFENENTLFLFATIDRILSAQRSTRLRQWSNRIPLAYKIIIGNALFWLLVSSHRLVYYSNSNDICEAKPGAYFIFDTYLDAFLSGIMAPASVIVSAILLWRAVRNVAKRYKIRNRVGAASLAINQIYYRQTDLQLTVMMLLQSILAIITYVPFGIFLFYWLITYEWIKSPVQQAWEHLIICFVRLCSCLFSAGSFYISMVSNRGFRKQFLYIFSVRKAIHPTGLTIPTN